MKVYCFFFNRDVYRHGKDGKLLYLESYKRLQRWGSFWDDSERMTRSLTHGRGKTGSPVSDSLASSPVNSQFISSGRSSGATRRSLAPGAPHRFPQPISSPETFNQTLPPWWEDTAEVFAAVLISWHHLSALEKMRSNNEWLQLSS